MRIIFATGNEGKMREIRMIMADLGLEILSMKEAGLFADVDENGLVRLVGEGKTILTIVSREQPQLKIEIPVIVKQPEKPTEEEPATKELTTEATTTEKPTENPADKPVNNGGNDKVNIPGVSGFELEGKIPDSGGSNTEESKNEDKNIDQKLK